MTNLSNVEGKTEIQAIEQTTEKLILEAAEKEFMQKGFAGARTASIAKAAGVTHGLMHYYFRTKEHLFEIVLSKKIAILGNIMLSSIEDNGRPFLDRIADAIERHFDFVAANPDLPRFLISEVFNSPERMAIVEEQLKKKAPRVVVSLNNEILRWSEKGVCKRVDAVMLLIDILSLNIFCFMASPLINTLFNNKMQEPAFLARRKKENVETILKKLQK